MRGHGARTYDASLPDGCKYMLFFGIFCCFKYKS